MTFLILLVIAIFALPLLGQILGGLISLVACILSIPLYIFFYIKELTTGKAK